MILPARLVNSKKERKKEIASKEMYPSELKKSHKIHLFSVYNYHYWLGWQVYTSYVQEIWLVLYIFKSRSITEGYDIILCEIIICTELCEQIFIINYVHKMIPEYVKYNNKHPKQ